MKSKFFPALATLVGTTMGAGFLGLPYIVAKSGFLIGLIYMVFVFAFILLVKLYLGEIDLRTKGNFQLTGYAKKYLGKTGKAIMFFSMIFGIFSALIAYLIAEGTSISFIIFRNFNYAFLFSIAFWFLMTIMTYIGLKALKKYEKIGVVLILALVALIFLFFIGRVNIENLTYSGKEIFAPFGVVVFSFLAFSAMPEVGRILSGQEKLTKKVVLIGMSIPLIVYLIFTFVVVGVYGKNVNEIATLSLGRFFSILGVLTMFTAFFTQTIVIRDMFRFDYGLGRFKGWLLACFLPLILFLLISIFKLATFIQILSIAGIVSGGLTGILILLMNIKAKKLGNRKPEYSIKINWFIILALSLIFIAAVIAEFVL